MNIFIDGRSISHPRRGGFKTYIENLVAALADIPCNDEFTIIYDRSYQFLPIVGNARFHQVACSARVRMIGQVYREQIALPTYARRYPGALWHFPYNTAPRLGIEGYVLTLHDVTSFTHAARPDWSRPARALQDVLLYYYPRFFVYRSARRARAIITVSNYARKEIVQVLGISADKVFVTPLAAQPIFRLLNPEEKQAARQVILEKYGLGRPFLITVASSLLKNPQGVLEAYARLPIELQEQYDLVIVMAHERNQVIIETLARQLGVTCRVSVLINLGPEELVWLYNLAEVLVYPSITESFPLPTAEAMACGTPIICSNTTGFPEQVGNVAITVSPNDTHEITSALVTVLASSELRQRMSEAGLRRSKSLSWITTAQQTLEIYKASHLHDAPRRAGCAAVRSSKGPT
jgi:glycosyltransferase involved in cell wall biosynthesis